MKRAICLLLVLATVLLLSGCASFFHREYSVVEPHSSDYYESEDVLRAENYQEVVNDLLILVGEQKKDGIIWLYRDDSAIDVTQLAEQACREVQGETPLGSYAVEYLTYTIDNTPRNYAAISLTIGYRRTAAQMDAIVHATSISALPNLLQAAVEKNVAELTVQVSYFEHQEKEVLAMVADAQSRSDANDQEPWQVNFYPEGQNANIIEIILKK